MSVVFRILPDFGLVYVRHGTVARLPDTHQAFQAYTRHPEFKVGQRQLVDLSHVRQLDHDYVELFKLQMFKTEVFYGRESQTLLVYYAPTPIALELARLNQRGWDAIPGVVAVVQQDEVDALTVLGLPHKSIAELLQATSALG